jgi:hypothetical protein
MLPFTRSPGPWNPTIKSNRGAFSLMRRAAFGPQAAFAELLLDLHF